jgi:MFS family permease
MTTAQAPQKRPSTLSPLAHRAFRWLLFASLGSNLANAVQSVGASWTMTGLTAQADMVALVQTATSLPIMAFALVGGAVADVHRRHRVMLVCQILMGAIALLLAFLTARGLTSPWSLLGLTFALGVGLAFYNPSVQAGVSHIVPRAELAGAINLQILGFNVARSLGPAIGGAIVAAYSPTAAFLITALGYFSAAAIIFARKPLGHLPAANPGGSLGRAIGEGLSFATRSPQVRTILIRAVTFTLAGSAAWALMPLVAKELIGGGPSQFGLLLGALGIGAVLGAGISHPMRARFSPEAITAGAGVVYGLACIAVAAQPGLWLSFAALVIGGAGWLQALSGFSVTGQLWSPRAIVGRVAATINMVVFGGLALGSWLWGHAADTFGLAQTMALSGGLMVVLPLLGLILPLPRHEDAPAH